jgi:hypothetical protein
MTDGLVLTGAAAILTAAPGTASSPGAVSISITAKALTTIDLLLADCADIALAEVADAPGQRRYEMVTTPLRLDTLSDDPAVTIRGSGIPEQTVILVAVQFNVDDRLNGRAFVVNHRFGEVRLGSQTPTASWVLPRAVFKRDE